MTKKIICALALPLALAGCGQRSAAEKAVREAMKDPDSAKFGTFYYNSKTGKACLTTNAKNSLGGYTGDSQSELLRDKEGWHYVSDGEESPADCRSNYADDPRSEVDAVEQAAANLHDAADNGEGSH